MGMLIAPSAPLQLSSNRLTPTSMIISWSPPEFPNGIIRRYKVVYRKAFTGNDSYKAITIQANSRSVNLGDLQESGVYIVWVRVTAR